MYQKIIYLDAVLELGRDVSIKIFRNFKVQYKTHPLSITITKEHGSWISRQLQQGTEQDHLKLLRNKNTNQQESAAKIPVYLQ
jgi:hypothetical protein